jgi:uncharacterized protein (UPF0297 family)
MKEILYMVMMFQRIVYGSQDLTEKVAIEIFKEVLCKGEARSNGINIVVGYLLEKQELKLMMKKEHRKKKKNEREK